MKTIVIVASLLLAVFLVDSSGFVVHRDEVASLSDIPNQKDSLDNTAVQADEAPLPRKPLTGLDCKYLPTMIKHASQLHIYYCISQVHDDIIFISRLYSFSILVFIRNGLCFWSGKHCVWDHILTMTADDFNRRNG